MPKLTPSFLFQAALALVMLAAGSATVFGFDRMGARFAALGAGDLLRVGAGLVQILAAVALITPGRAAYGAALALAVSLGAVVAHASVLGLDGAPPAMALAVASGIVLARNRVDFQR
jgi:putative oxidoreductase